MYKSFVFPGQGSQFSGMGKDLYERSQQAARLMESAAGILGFDILPIMFEGTEDELRNTRIAQPAIYIHSVAQALCGELERPDMAAGHSLGEFSALAAAGVFCFEEGLRLVQARAEEMQKCCEKTPGTMAAVIGLAAETVERICAETEGVVVPANYNCPGQIVISGEKAAVERAIPAMKAAGARRALPLNVGGAFHSPLMESAREALAVAIDAIPFRAPAFPVYQNVSAKAERDPERIKANLLLQLTSPVRWTACVEAMAADGAVDFVEVGPGEVLGGLIRRIINKS
ncbi:MAG: ACP S-malonyltransferase [Bacteroidales bacterium]|nr:ACP S-malonyltransferase [Bacteroidales bacterium]